MIDYSVIKSEWAMMNSPFQKTEIEFMICQTYLACQNYGKSKVDMGISGYGKKMVLNTASLPQNCTKLLLTM